MMHLAASNPSADESHGSAALQRSCRFVFWILICILPLFFGGVHAVPSALALALVFFAAAIVTHGTGFSLAKQMRFVHTTVFVLGALCAYLLLFWIVGMMRRSEHPVLGSISALLSPAGYFTSWLYFAGGVACVVLTVAALIGRLIDTERLLRMIAISGAIVSVTALAHWFHDNGRLFWSFAPENIFSSPRARWPYVNANNLGHHLILTLFPALYLLMKGVRSLFRVIDTMAARRPLTMLDLINAPGVQVKLLRAMFDLFTTVSIVLALLASQSRGSWIGAAITVLGYLCVDRVLHRRHAALNPRESAEALRERRRRNRPLEGTTFFDTAIYVIRKVSFSLGILVAAALLLLFLRDRGLDMVLDRAEYGLLASKDDIRWLMYENTLPLIAYNPIFGVGLGGWSVAFGQHVDPSLARLNPVYLHSDPLQFIAETGIVGSFPMLALGAWLIWNAVCRIKAMQSYSNASALLTVLCSLVALCVSSLFDFPFRMTAILLLFCVLLGMLLTLMEPDVPHHESK